MPWAIVETNSSGDVTNIKKVFDDEYEALKAVFSPYSTQEIDIDTLAVAKEVGARLTPIERYALNCYNEVGLRNYLGLD